MNAPPANDIMNRPLPGGWLVVGLLWVVGCLNYLDRVMLTTMRVSIKEAIPMGDDDFGMLTTVFLVVYGVLSPVGGWLADRFNRSRIIIFSLAVWSLTTWATSYAQSYHQLLVTRAIMGISEACYIPAALALIADYHRGTTRSFATGLHMSGLYAGMAMGGMGGWVAEGHGWSVSFFMFGCIGVVYAGVLAAFLRDAPVVQNATGAASEPVGLGEALVALGGSRPFWIVTLHWGLSSFGGWAFITWLPTFLQEHHHLTQTSAGFTGPGFNQGSALAGVLLGGAWADKWSRTQLRARVWVPMIAFIIASPLVFMISQTDVLWIAIGGLIAFGFARGCMDANMMPILCQITDPRHRATGYGILNCLGCTIGGGSAYLGGWLKEKHLPLAYLLAGSALLMLVAGLLLAFVRPVRRG